MPDRVLCVVQARTGSTRLPGKVLADLGGRPMLRFLLDRLRPLPFEVVVATSTLAGDDAVADVARDGGIPVVRGSERDVLDRYLGAVQAHAADHVIRITGDCPLVDADIVQATVALHLERAADYTCNVLPRTFPKGLDVEVVDTAALRIAGAEAVDGAEREHVTPFLYRRPERFRLANLMCDEDLGLERWTVDTQGDLDFVRRVVTVLGDRAFTWQDVLACVGRQVTPVPGELWLRPARAADVDLLLHWRNDPVAVAFSRSAAVVEAAEHGAWFTRRLADPGTRIWIGELDGRPVGFVRIDVHSGTGEVSIAVDPRLRGIGVGARLLEALADVLAGDEQIVRRVAVVREDNVASLRLFASAGYVASAADDAWLTLEWASPR